MRAIDLKKLVFIAAAAAVFNIAGAAHAKTPLANSQCPVMKGEQAKEKYFVDYKGQRVNLCCKTCIKRFNKNPEKYMARLHAAQ